MPKNIQGGKNYKKFKRVDKNIIPNDINNEDYIIAKVEKIHNKSHCSVKSMDGNKIEDIFCSKINSVKFIKIGDLVLIYKYNIENHFAKRNNDKNKEEKKKSIIVTLLDNDKLNILTKKYKFNYKEDKKLDENELNIIFNDNEYDNSNVDELDIDIDDI